MKKTLIATKVKDGYSIELIKRTTANDRQEVMDIIRYEGLIYRPHFSKEPDKENSNEIIYAD